MVPKSNLHNKSYATGARAGAAAIAICVTEGNTNKHRMKSRTNYLYEKIYIRVKLYKVTRFSYDKYTFIMEKSL